MPKQFNDMIWQISQSNIQGEPILYLKMFITEIGFRLIHLDKVVMLINNLG